MIRVHLVDDHTLVRDGLVRVLDAGEDLEVVAIAPDGETAVEQDDHVRADVVLMDMSMPGIGGVEATRRLLQRRPDARVVMLTAHTERDKVLAALDAGAIGYLAKDQPTSALLDGVRAAAAGTSPMDPRAAHALLGARQQAPSSEITDREREVLVELARGSTNQQIARALGISEKTVKAHLTRIFSAIGANGRTQAAMWARDRGFVD